MLRMEMACFFVIMLMSIIYFSAKRDKTQIHKVFSGILLLSMFHLIFDAASVYTMNRMDKVSGGINNVMQRIFIASMILLCSMFYRYIVLLVEEETGYQSKLAWVLTIFFLFAMLASVVLPISYKETSYGYYSEGMATMMAYMSVAVLFIGVGSILIRHWKRIHAKKRIAVTTAMGIGLIISIYQIYHPMALMSGMGITLITLAFYLTMENPDIVLLEQIREEKKKVEIANEAKSAFLSHVSHEIRTPMNAVYGMTELMLRTELNEEQREYLYNIKKSGNVLITMINDIIDVSIIESGKVELVKEDYRLEAMLSDICILMQSRIGNRSVELICEIDPELPTTLHGDGIRIRQVLLNLLGNAIHFTNEGQVKLRIDVASSDSEGVDIHMSVSDTGVGIRPEDAENVFKVFEKADVEEIRGKGGVGLGLPISAALVSFMGGKLEMKSEYGKGSEFYFTIRQEYAKKPEKEEDEEEEGKAFTAPEANILIVDDSMINLKVATELLSPLKVKVDTAENGKKALAMLMEKKYDLIFMDHMMPGMDGVETTKCLRQSPQALSWQTPVIAFTANVVKEAREGFIAAGMEGFLSKPIEVKPLFRAVRRFLAPELILYTDRKVAGELSEIGDENENLKELCIEGIDTKEGMKTAGSIEFYREILADFYLLIDTKSIKIEKCMEDRLFKDYTIEVHALKSSARFIGAMELSNQFAMLEKLGQEEKEEEILKNTPEVLACYRRYKELLKPFYQENQKEKKQGTQEDILFYLKGIQDAADGFDLDGIDTAMEKLEEYALPKASQEKMEMLRVSVADVALEDIMRLSKEIEMDLMTLSIEG